MALGRWALPGLEPAPQVTPPHHEPCPGRFLDESYPAELSHHPHKAESTALALCYKPFYFASELSQNLSCSSLDRPPSALVWGTRKL